MVFALNADGEEVLLVVKTASDLLFLCLWLQEDALTKVLVLGFVGDA